MSGIVSSLMQHRVRTIDMDDTVVEVEGLLARERLSWASVTNSAGQVVGVISATDLLRSHAARQVAAPITAWQLCTYKPITVAPDTTLEDLGPTHGRAEDSSRCGQGRRGDRRRGVVARLRAYLHFRLRV